MPSPPPPAPFRGLRPCSCRAAQVGDTFRVDAAVVANAAFDGQSSTSRPTTAPTPASGPPAPIVTQRQGVTPPSPGSGMLSPSAAAMKGRSDVDAVGTAGSTAAAATSASSPAAASISGGGAVTVRSIVSRSSILPPCYLSYPAPTYLLPSSLPTYLPLSQASPSNQNPSHGAAQHKAWSTQSPSPLTQYLQQPEPQGGQKQRQGGQQQSPGLAPGIRLGASGGG